ncbi:formate dehydrogenase subunit delta [Sphingomonas sp. GB1N7]|uniref:formate dehydrogenase subunit delta n=1 Tax=Parasphingomonas caseinilytica TaxID=3096158 RepID=UPI002FC5F73D
MSTEDRLVYMVNQIARNFAIGGAQHAAEATADHIASFWDPRMKEQILLRSRMPGNGLDSIGAEAIALLPIAPSLSPVSAATDFTGGSDAG